MKKLANSIVILLCAVFFVSFAPHSVLSADRAYGGVNSINVADLWKTGKTAPEGTVMTTSTDYPWTMDNNASSAAGFNVYSAGNSGVDSSESTLTVTVNGEGYLHYKYAVSSESKSYDYQKYWYNNWNP